MKVLVLDVIEIHASTVARIIETENIYVEIEIVENDLEDLIKAIESLNPEEYDLIHFSIGVNEYSRRLESALMKLFNQGVTMVAAFDNNGSLSFPASFPFVIGVDNEKYISEKTVLRDGVVNIKFPLRPIKVGNELLNGTSYTSAIVSKELCESNNRLSKVRETYNLVPEKLIPDCDIEKLDTVYVYPFGKEVKSLVENHDHDLISSLTVFDEKALCRTYSDETITVLNIDNCLFDCTHFILSHHNFSKHHISRQKKIISTCCENKIPIFLFDETMEDYILKNHPSLLYYVVGRVDREIKTEGKLYKGSIPVIGVYGTSSKQGKFTLLNKLKDEFKANGANVDGIGTEPQSQFCGFSETFINGHLSPDITYSREILSVNQKLLRLENMSIDLIMFSTQSSILPREINNIYNFSKSPNPLLFSLFPDVNILVINIYDDIAFIENGLFIINLS